MQDGGRPGENAGEAATALADPGPALPDAGDRAWRRGRIVVALAVVSGFATYLILTGLTPMAPRSDVVLAVLLINALLIAAMLWIIASQMAELARAWREKVAGARLHVRIVALFSVIAAIPALILALAATTTFSSALDSWFSTRTREIIRNSIEVANAYVEEHGQVIRTDIVNMARDLDDAKDAGGPGSAAFRNLVLVHAGLRDLPVAYVIDRAGQPLVTAIEDPRIPYRAPPADVIEAAESGQVPVLTPDGRDPRVGAVVKLASHPGQYLYVARGVSPRVMTHLKRTTDRFNEYEELRRRRSGLKIAHALMYLMISTTALLAAIWVGMWFAGRLVAPIRRLIAGAQEVSKGNLKVRLPVRRGEGDLRRLSQTFNTMTAELKTQRDALVDANDQLLERRRFMEALLAGVSAGVLGVDSVGVITIANSSALKLLAREEGDLVGRTLAEAVPEFAALDTPETALKGQKPDSVSIAVNGVERMFAARVTHEQAGGEDQGSVVTFDDVTELVTAQRTSAWADVARRIAHEIKNPLTPIQLSAERLRRKYGKVITDDRETFERLTQTIERQVGDIKGMVDEFASFARMRQPEMATFDLREAVQEPVIQYRETHGAIRFELKSPPTPLTLFADRRLLTQAITNVVKNAAEAVQQVAESRDRPADWKGSIEAVVRLDGGRAVIEVIDNGPGLPKQNRARLLEPYVTTKGTKGTGLGLAIVQKIVEQHGGVLSLEDAPAAPGRSRGAMVRIVLPVRVAPPSAGAGSKEAAE
jgi:two-component system nitrogen regulation sensor histidine kinase NtrY